jgi:hypothetical protein
MAAGRLIWAVNHKVLLKSELPILQSLGWEVFVPRIVAAHEKSAATTAAFDDGLSIPSGALATLIAHDFNFARWTPEVTDAINDHFSVLICPFYPVLLHEAARRFRGRLVARAFGREHPRRYAEFAFGEFETLVDDFDRLGCRFVFAQAYDSLAEIEPEAIGRRARTVTVPLAPDIFELDNTWTGAGGHALFVCRDVARVSYYRSIYERIKTHFGDLPHRIFGYQSEPVDDPAVLPNLSDDEVNQAYADATVFAYPHAEPRHLHFSPLEAMVIGTPVLFLKDSMLDALAGKPLPGTCRDERDMRAKIERLLGGDRAFGEEIRAAQRPILDHFSADLAKRQWREAIGVPSFWTRFRRRLG